MSFLKHFDGLARKGVAVFAAATLVFGCIPAASAFADDSELMLLGGDHVEANEAVASAQWRWPVPGVGADHISGHVQMWPYRHDGVDIWGEKGTPIVASRSGIVSTDETSGTMSGYGNAVAIDHGDGTASLYAHMDSRIVSEGDSVVQGQVIGYMGNTGVSSGDHLHFEIRILSTPYVVTSQVVDPEPFIVGNDFGDVTWPELEGDGPDDSMGGVQGGGSQEVHFLDVDYGSWYGPYVSEASSRGILAGVGEGCFDPNGNVTRAQLVAILWRMAESGAAQTVDSSLARNETPFSDVDSGQYYTAALNWAYANGIVSYSSDLAFRPNDPVSRQEMAVLFCKCAQYEGLDCSCNAGVSLGRFIDAGQIDEWAANSVAWCTEAGIISGNGLSDGTFSFNPDGTATRAQISKVSVDFDDMI